MKGCNQPAMMVRLNKKRTEVLIISLALEGKVSRTLTCVVGGGMAVVRKKFVVFDCN